MATETIEQSNTQSFTNKFAKDLVAGFISGCVGLYVGYPLDTIKVRMQLEKKKVSCTKTIAKIYRNEGVRGMFKGVLSPVIGRAPVTSIVFATNDSALKAMQDWDMSQDSKSLLAGICAGMTSIPITTPVEYLKVKKQGFEGKGKTYSALLRKAGPTGIFTGMVPTFFRDVPNYGVYFYTYSVMKKYLGLNQNHLDDTPVKHKTMKTMIAGGWAGTMSWLTGYPTDVIKSYVQFHPHKKSMHSATKHLYRKYGIKHFYRGMSPCLVRAFPVNGIVFVGYEYIIKLLE